MSREWAGGDGAGNEMIRVLRARVELNDNADGCLTVNTPFTIAVEYRTNLTADLFYVRCSAQDYLWGTGIPQRVLPTPMLIEPAGYTAPNIQSPAICLTMVYIR